MRTHATSCHEASGSRPDKLEASLGAVYIMGREVVPRPCKICDWLLNSFRDHFGLHQGKNVRVTMKFKVPKRHILRPTLSTDMVQRVLRWEKQKRCFIRKKIRAHGREMML